jgi:hypothetical protein
MSGLNFLKSFLPIAASFIPGIGEIAGPALGAIMGGRGNKNSVQQAQQMDAQQWQNQLQAMRPNLTNASGATQEWTQDPTTGKWSRKEQLGAEEQKRRDIYNQIALSRMNQASGMNLNQGGGAINYKAYNPSLGGSYLGQGAQPPVMQPPAGV